MSWRIVVQPDGRFAVFSTVVDDFVATNATAGDIEDLFINEAMDRAKDNASKALARARDNPSAFDECEATRKAAHGDP